MGQDEEKPVGIFLDLEIFVIITKILRATTDSRLDSHKVMQVISAAGGAITEEDRKEAQEFFNSYGKTH